MSEHELPINFNDDEPALPNQRFFAWLRSQTGLFVGQIVGLLTVVSFITALIYHARNAGLQEIRFDPETIGHFTVYLHLPFLASAIAFLIRMLGDNSRGRFRAGLVRDELIHENLRDRNADKELKTLRGEGEAQVGRFKRRFLWFWYSMLLLYISFALQQLIADPGKIPGQISQSDRVFAFLTFALNNLSLIFIFSCFAVLYLPTDATPLDPATERESNDPSATPTDPSTTAPAKLQQLFKSLRDLSARSFSRIREFAKQQEGSKGRFGIVISFLRDKQAELTKVLKRVGEGAHIPERFRTSWKAIGAPFGRVSGKKLGEVRYRQRKLVRRFALVVTAFTLAYVIYFPRSELNELQFKQFAAAFDGLSGVVNAVVLALLIARLDSKLIGLPSWLICVLYCYAGVQPLFIVFELDPKTFLGIKTAVFIVVFIFKVYFFLIISYSLQTGRMFDYFFCSRILNDQINKLKEARIARLSAREPNVEEAGNSQTQPVSKSPSSEHAPLKTSAKPASQYRGDRLLIWSKRLGALTIALFAGSLVFYVAGFKFDGLVHLLSFDNPSKQIRLVHLKLGLIAAHVLLLLAVSLRILIARINIGKAAKETQDSNHEEFKKLSKARFDQLVESKLDGSSESFKKLCDLTKPQFKRFLTWFLLFWVSLLALYLALAIVTVNKYYPKFLPPNVTGHVANSRPAPETKQNPVDQFQDRHSHHSVKPSASPAADPQPTPAPTPIPPLIVFDRVKSSILFLLLNNLAVLFVFLCFSVLYIPGDHKGFKKRDRLALNYAWVSAILLTLIPPLLVLIIKHNDFHEPDLTKIPLIFSALGGTLSAVAYALLIARLDSRIIGLPSALIAVLYSYAALQPLFVAFDQASELFRVIEILAIFAALMFKVCLILMVIHLSRSKALIDYLWFFPILNDKVNSVFDNQFEIRSFMIKPDKFSFLVVNKNVEVYWAETSYETRHACDQAVRKLVACMREEKSFGKPEGIQGTYWLEVKDLDGYPICQSKGQSAQERDELIIESNAKIPFCKYNRRQFSGSRS